MNIIDLKKIGERIRRIRKEAKITQGALAIEMGTHQSIISSIENGEKSPDVEVLAKLSRKFNLSLDELVFGREDKSQDALQRVAEELSSYSEGERQKTNHEEHDENTRTFITESIEMARKLAELDIDDDILAILMARSLKRRKK